MTKSRDLGNLAQSVAVNLPTALGSAGSNLVVNSGGNGLEFADAGGSGTTVHDTLSAMTSAATPDEGTLHYNKENDTLYVKAPNGFYAIATITNNSPTFDTNGVSQTTDSSTSTIAADGIFTLTAGTNTVVTINASDADVGQTLTYSATLQSGTQSDVLQSFTQGTGSNTNVFTLVPATSGGGTVEYRFTVSDGTNSAVRDASFTVKFTVANSRFTTHLITGANPDADGLSGDNNNIVDTPPSGGSAQTITANNDAHAASFSPYRHGGYSTQFPDSVTNGIRPKSGNEPAYGGTGDLTVECWIYPTTAADSQQGCILDQRPAGPTNGHYIMIQRYNVGPQGGIAFHMDSGWRINSTDLAPANQWTHIAIVRSSGVYKMYINGAVQSSTYSSTADNNSSAVSAGPYVGLLRTSSPSNPFYGYIRDVRFTSSAQYTSNFTSDLPTSLAAITGTTFLTCHKPYALTYDTASATNTEMELISGSVNTVALSPYDYAEYSEATNGGSIYFDGNAASLQLTASSDLQALGRTGTAATIEAWVYLNSTPSSNGTAVYSLGTAGSTGGSNVLSFEIRNNRTLRALVSGAYDVTAGNTAATSTGTVQLKAWTHIALVLHNQTWTLYINGTADGTSTGNYPSGTNHSTAFVGRVFYDNGRDADMFVSDLRITSDAQYTSNFTPPTAPLTTVSNTKLHIKGTDAHIVDKAQNNKTIAVRNGAVSTNTLTASTTPPWIGAAWAGTSAMDVTSGATAAIQLLDTDPIGTQDFTLEFWYYAVAFGSFDPLVEQRPGNGTAPGILLYDAPSIIYKENGTTMLTGANLMTATTWHHISICRSGSTVNGYVDGVRFDTETSNTNISGTQFNIGVFNDSGLAWGTNAYFQDFRLMTGYARYTLSDHSSSSSASIKIPDAPLKG